MTRITLNDTIQSTVVKMSDGNPGAMTVLMKLLQKEHGIFKLLKLDTLGIYGSAIWVVYKDLLGEDIDVLDRHLAANTLESTILAKCREDEYFKREWEMYT